VNGFFILNSRFFELLLLILLKYFHKKNPFAAGKDFLFIALKI